MKIAIIGTGSIGKRHITNLLALGFNDLLVASEHSKRESFEHDGVTIPVVHSYQEALDQSEAIIIANPSSFHFEYLDRAINEGKHIYIEKPIALNAVGLDALANKASEKGLIIAVGTQFRFNHRLLELKKILEEKTLGKILAVTATCGEHIADYHPEEDYRISYAARSELGGGVLLTQIHQVDYLDWLFGGYETVSAIEVDVPELEIDVEGSVSYFLRSKDNLPVAGHLNYLQRPKHTSLEVIGTLGKVIWDYGDNRLDLINNAGEIQVFRSPFDRNQMFIDIIQDFVDCIHSGDQPRANLEDGIASLRLVDAIKESCANKEMVRI